MEKKKYMCEYCEKQLSTKSNLIQHQKTNKTCRKIRGINDDNYECDYCGKTFSRTYTLDRHLCICSAKQKQESQEKYENLLIKFRNKKKEMKLKLKEQKEEYQGKLIHEKEKNKKLREENIRMKDEIFRLNGKINKQEGINEGFRTAPDKKTIYNTAYVNPKLIDLPINNIPALTHEYMIEKINDGILTYERATKGYRGLLEAICELITHENEDGIIERNYVCTDVSRNSFHRLLESKKWKSDKGGRYLNSMINTFRSVMEEHKDRAYEIYEKTLHDSFDWGQVDWERKNVALLYSGVVCNEGAGDREELVNVLRKEISKRASV